MGVTIADPEDPMMRRIRLGRTEPSPRHPYRNWRSNPPDRIEKQLQEDSHRVWGFVIYRTTYDNDADWKEFLRRLQFRMKDDFDAGNGLDILEMFKLTVMNDRENLDGVDSATVRRHFLQWRASALASEQGRNGDEPAKPGLSPRYRFAIQVDADALRSVVHDAPDPAERAHADIDWVKIIDAAWQQGNGTRQSLRANLGEGLVLSMALPCTDDNHTFPTIEGMTQKYVGWMKIAYDDVQSETYVNARDRNWWSSNYRRPPQVLGWYHR